MRDKCKYCQCFAKIYKHQVQSTDVQTRYLHCTNPECGHRWTQIIAYDKTLTAPADMVNRDAVEIAFGLLRSLPPLDRKAMAERLAGASVGA